MVLLKAAEALIRKIQEQREGVEEQHKISQ